MSQVSKWAVAGVAAFAMASLVCAQDKAPATAVAEKALAPEKAAVKIVRSAFHKADANKDAKWTAAEQEVGMKEWFKAMDADKDGKVTPEEFVAQRFVNIDVNKDGSVTMEEYLVFFADIDASADKTAACDKLDANGDGEVTAVEVIAYRKSVFAAMDGGKDGKVTPEAMKAAGAKQFKDVDANKDGFVTVEEMVAIIPVPAAAPKVEEKKADQPAK